MLDDKCVCCGEYVPEGKMVCPICENAEYSIKKGCGIMANNNPMFNSSGCKDPTAYEAMKPIIKEDAELESKVNFMVKVLKFIISQSGFELLNRIEVKDRRSGRVFK